MEKRGIREAKRGKEKNHRNKEKDKSRKRKIGRDKGVQMERNEK